MSLLTDFNWRTKYDPDDGTLIEQFYLTALACAQRYDRTTGYFSATALAIAARGIEGLVLNAGRMRMVVGCTLGQSEVNAYSWTSPMFFGIVWDANYLHLPRRAWSSRQSALLPHSNCSAQRLKCAIARRRSSWRVL